MSIRRAWPLGAWLCVQQNLLNPCWHPKIRFQLVIIISVTPNAIIFGPLRAWLQIQNKIRYILSTSRIARQDSICLEYIKQLIDRCYLSLLLLEEQLDKTPCVRQDYVQWRGAKQFDQICLYHSLPTLNQYYQTFCLFLWQKVKTEKVDNIHKSLKSSSHF